ncbi:MAG TPA: hypothetical protein VK607_09515 [Kofleriaceae bacterium]|nr:hypothetical protein [Kofleriaceae bacterium]
MARRAWFVLAILAAGCGKGGDSGPPAGSGAGSGTGTGSTAEAADRITTACEPLPFAESAPVPEASGAAWIPVDGKLALLVVGDSGNHGAYAIVDPDSGATLETGKLPLSDEVSDDLEGVSALGDRIYGLTSSGWILVWRREGKGFALIDKPYPLGPVDLPDTKNNDRPPRGDGMVCNGRVVNCGRNYEGLCLAPAATPAARPGACVGFAASKADGHAYCLTEDAGKLVVHHDRAIAITPPGKLADCTFSDDGALWLGSNLFDLSRVYRIAHWQDPATASVELIGPLPIGFPELIAVRGDIVYRMSDMGGAPSLMAKFRCKR